MTQIDQLQPFKIDAKSIRIVNPMSMIRGSLGGLQIFNHIFLEKGGSTISILGNILSQKESVFPVNPENIVEDTFVRYGPGIVTGFCVYREFTIPDNVIFDDETKHQDLPTLDISNLKKTFNYWGQPASCPQPRDDPIATHSMVIFGVAFKGGIKYFFIQNWWPRSQFIIVSEKYLKSCDPLISFCKSEEVSFEQFNNYVSLKKQLDTADLGDGFFVDEQ